MSELEEELIGCEDLDYEYDLDEEEEEALLAGEPLHEDESDAINIGVDEEVLEELDEDQNEEVGHIQPQHTGGSVHSRLGLRQTSSQHHGYEQEEIEDEHELHEEYQEHVVSEELEGHEENHTLVEEEEEEEEEEESPRTRFRSERSKTSLTTTKLNRNIPDSLDEVIKKNKLEIPNVARGGRGGQNRGRGGRGMARGGTSSQVAGPRFPQGTFNRFQGPMSPCRFQVQQWNRSPGLMGPRGMGMFGPNQQGPLQMRMPMRGQIQGPAVGIMSFAGPIGSPQRPTQPIMHLPNGPRGPFFPGLRMPQNVRFRMNGPNDGIRFPMNNAGLAGQQVQNQNSPRPITPQQKKAPVKSRLSIPNTQQKTGVTPVAISQPTKISTTVTPQKAPLKRTIIPVTTLETGKNSTIITPQKAPLKRAGVTPVTASQTGKTSTIKLLKGNTTTTPLGRRIAPIEAQATTSTKRPLTNNSTDNIVSAKQIKLEIPPHKNAISMLHEIYMGKQIKFCDKDMSKGLKHEFECSVVVEGQQYKGVGKIKKIAKKNAAEAAILALME
ncbi:unnamed protein product, partial [Meganyctiphanes norvegica]